MPVSALGRLLGVWLRQRSPAGRAAVWILAVAGPAVIAAVLMPFRSTIGLGGFLSCALLVVITVAVIGGLRPLVTAIVIGVVAGAIIFAPPYDSLKVAHAPDVVSLVAFALVGVAVGILANDLARLLEDQAVQAGVEAALRRVATLVAGGASPDEVFGAVTEEVGRLLHVDRAGMGHYESDGMVTFITSWSNGGSHFPTPGRWKLGGNNVPTLVSQTGRPARLEGKDATGPIGIAALERGPTTAAGAPIVVDGRLWGVMIAGRNVEEPLPEETEARLASFTELVATAIANAESRDEVARLAEEQAALGRVATLVARAAAPQELFAAATEEVGRLLHVTVARLCRYDPDGAITVVGAWSCAGDAYPVGTRLVLGDESISALVWQTGRSARVDHCTTGADGSTGPGRDESLRSTAGTPIVVSGRLWGMMGVGSDAEHPLPPETESRLTAFTDLVAMAIANADSRADLAASRARIVAASDETRRGIERDLHDGAQQQLVSLGLELRAAQAMLPPELDQLGRELSRVAVGLGNVQNDLREMARGIHPAILAEGGLGPALKTLARRSPIPVELEVQTTARLPEPLEVAAYYVVSETLTNAAKHAHASVVRVEVDAIDHAVHIAVLDDGNGGADPTRGSGLVGLKDRVEALGGAITVESAVGSGTSVHVELPLDG